MAKRTGQWYLIANAPTTGVSIQTYPHYRSAYWDNGFQRWVKRSIKHKTVIPLDPQPTHWQHHSPPPDTEKPYITEMMESGDEEQIVMAIMMKAEEGE